MSEWTKADDEDLAAAFFRQKPAHAERRLWQGVINQALLDATSTNQRETQERDEARRFLDARRWDFRAYCDLAGYCPHWVHRRYVKLLAENGMT